MAIANASFWINATPITVALSPLVSPWISVARFANVIPSFAAFVGGTSVHSLEWSLDGLTVDPDYPATTALTGLPTPAAVPVIAPFVRWKTVQTVADATKSKVALMAR
jgi:hypothetical protein